MTLAPIILFTYNRPWHTEQTLLALEKNELASQSSLFVYSDGPKENASDEDVHKVEEVRELVEKRNWCKEVTLVAREKNVGLAHNVINGITEVINEYGRVIVLEDDIITSRYFLNYMNDALEVYEHHEKVFGATGYTYPNKLNISEESFFLPVACSWSYATWKDRWNRINWNVDELLQRIEGKKDQFNFGGYGFFEMLRNNSLKKNDSWAVRFYAWMFLEEKWFLFPRTSLVENIGFDDSGTHCTDDDYFSKVKPEDYNIAVRELPMELPEELHLYKTNFFSGDSGRANTSDKTKTMSRVIRKFNKFFNITPNK